MASGNDVPELPIKLVAGEHAIEAETFSLAFAEPLTQADYSRFDDASDTLRQLFPVISPVSSYELHPQAGVLQVPEDRAGRELVEFGRDGKQEWSAGFHGNSIHVTIHKYTNWQEMWPLARQRINALLDCIDQQKQVIAVDFAVVDTFFSHLPELKLLPSVVVNADSVFISPKILECSDPRWDIQQGWMARQVDKNLKLTRVDIQAGIQNNLSRVSVQNVLSFRPEVPKLPTLGSLRSEDDGLCVIDRLIDQFHDENKVILTQILHDRVLKKLRLENGGR
jgi:uncharacterized protein (TIGR04255 family)